MRFLPVALLAVATSGAFAQAHNGPQPDGRRLRLVSDSFDVYFVRMGQQQRTGVVVDRLDTVRVNGQAMLRRIYRTTDEVLGHGVDTLVDAYSTLEPQSVRSRSDRFTERLDWRANRIVGVVQETDKPPRAVDSPVPPGWYNGASFDLILRASPLADGYEVSVPTFSGRQGSHVMTAKVTGSESLSGYGDTWRLDADFAGLPVTFWISKTSRRLVRQAMHVGPGTEIVIVAPAPGAST